MMKKIVTLITTLTFAISMVLFSHAAPAEASCSGVIPNVFVPFTQVATAAQVNQNFAYLLACALTVDHTQIGSGGIFASQIVPNSNAAATFGGLFGYTIQGLSANQTLLTLAANSAQTAPLFVVKDTTGATTFQIAVAGNSTFNSNLTGNSGLVVNDNGSAPAATALTVTGGNTGFDIADFNGFSGATGPVLQIGAGLSSSVPLTVNGTTSQSADLFDVWTKGAGSGGTKTVWIDSKGVLNFAGSGANLPNGPSITAGSFLDFNVATGNSFSFSSGAGGSLTFATINASGLTTPSINGTNGSWGIASGGQIAATAGGLSSGGYVPPVYNSSGTNIGVTTHIVVGTCTFAATNSCAVNFTGGAAFTNATSYSCTMSSTSSNGYWFGMNQGSGSAVAFFDYFNSGGTVTQPNVSLTFSYQCVGS